MPLHMSTSQTTGPPQAKVDKLISSGLVIAAIRILGGFGYRSSGEVIGHHCQEQQFVVGKADENPVPNHDENSSQKGKKCNARADRLGSRRLWRAAPEKHLGGLDRDNIWITLGTGFSFQDCCGWYPRDLRSCLQMFGDPQKSPRSSQKNSWTEPWAQERLLTSSFSHFDLPHLRLFTQRLFTRRSFDSFSSLVICCPGGRLTILLAYATIASGHLPLLVLLLPFAALGETLLIVASCANGRLKSTSSDESNDDIASLSTYMAHALAVVVQLVCLQA